jgi:hypothetical protein
MAIAKKILGKAIKKTRQEFGKPKVKKPIKISKAETKANARGLKAAQGKSLAPRGYKPDTRGRARAKEFAEPLIKSRGRKEAMRDGARALDIERTRLEFPKAPKNKRGR